jgi:hypothetical protein
VDGGALLGTADPRSTSLPRLAGAGRAGSRLPPNEQPRDDKGKGGVSMMAERAAGSCLGEGRTAGPPLRSPGFPVELLGVGKLHAAFLTESRTRGRW